MGDIKVDIEAHLICSIDWMNMDHHPEEVSYEWISLKFTREARLWHEYLGHKGHDLNRIQNIFMDNIQRQGYRRRIISMMMFQWYQVEHF